jgi:penicillin-binding protein 1A
MSTSPSTTEITKGRINKFFQVERPWFRKAIKYAWILFLCVFLGGPLYVYTVSINLFGLYGGMPAFKEIENPENDLSSELISADGVSLGSYYRFNRSQVSYHELSPELVNTLIISEDHRFYQHSGLDLPSYVRVVFGLLTFNPQGGGSTITQQLAKILFTRNPDRSLDGPLGDLGDIPKRLIQKTKEWIISVNLERNFTKEEIIAMYLNTFEFTSSSFGIKVAAKTYFNKPPDSLNLQESAVLVGMLQNPSRFHPKNFPERALDKRNEVLRKVYRAGYMLETQADYDSIAALPIELQYRVQNQNAGIATYFRTVIGNWLLAYCRSRGIDLYNSGLRIYTTIDSRLQKYAEEAVAEHMKTLQADFNKQWKERKMDPWLDEDNKPLGDFLKTRIKRSDAYKALASRYGEKSDSLRIMLNLKKPMTVFSWDGEKDTVFSLVDSLNYYSRFLQTGMMSMDPVSGHIRAWVGGINHKYFKFDHVKQGKRQAGSTFKPFVYGLAMEEGFSPCQQMKDLSPLFVLPGGGHWYPLNSNGTRGSGENMNLRQAMARSVNSITAQVMQQLGPANIVEFAHRVGVESNLDAVPSLCLGTSDVSVYEMVGAYGTYVNGGIFTRPFFISRIEDKNGNVIENFVPETRQAVSDQTAWAMLYMLMGGVEEDGGTSEGLPRELKIGNEIGGKTGTTNDASDGWYVGVTHDLVTGIWVGGDERAIRFPSWIFGSGSKSARPIWSNYMTKIYADEKTGITKGQFKRPPTGSPLSFDCNKVTGADSLNQYVVPFDINN